MKVGVEHALQPHDGEPVLFRLVGEPILELGIDGDLERDLLLGVGLLALQVGDPIIMYADGLLDGVELNVRTRSHRVKHRLGLIEDVEDIVEA